MRILLLILCFFIFENSFSQKDTIIKNQKQDSILLGTKACFSKFDTIQKRDVYWYVDKMPTFGDSINALNYYIAENLEYPVYADIEGNIYMRIIIEPDGQISYIKILKGIDPLLDSFALKLIKNMPDWKPGECKGIKVPVYITIPIRYKLN
ncbi:MAG: energy transducer TonB [Bacteroidales bacterium]|nr:energy transducer TonB [Bacteroidales bacterium]